MFFVGYVTKWIVFIFFGGIDGFFKAERAACEFNVFVSVFMVELAVLACNDCEFFLVVFLVAQAVAPIMSTASLLACFGWLFAMCLSLSLIHI